MTVYINLLTEKNMVIAMNTDTTVPVFIGNNRSRNRRLW